MGQLSPTYLPSSPPSILAFLLISSVTLVSPSLQLQYDVDHSSEESDLGHRHSSGMSKTDVTLQAMGKPKERPKNLTCHVCYSETDGRACMNFTTFHTSSYFLDGDDKDERDNEVHRDWSQDSPATNGFSGFSQQCHNESYVCSVRKLNTFWKSFQKYVDHVLLAGSEIRIFCFKWYGSCSHENFCPQKKLYFNQ